MSTVVDTKRAILMVETQSTQMEDPLKSVQVLKDWSPTPMYPTLQTLPKPEVGKKYVVREESDFLLDPVLKTGKVTNVIHAQPHFVIVEDSKVRYEVNLLHPAYIRD